MRKFADMVFVFKCLHGLVNFPATEIGLDLVTSITRGSGCRLTQRHVNSATMNLFAVRCDNMELFTLQYYCVQVDRPIQVHVT